MSQARIGFIRVAATQSKDMKLDHSGWCSPSIKDFKNFEDALSCFNKLIKNPKTTVADITLAMNYDEEQDDCTMSYVNWFTIAHYHHKAKSFENYASSQNFWKANEGKYPGISDHYRD
jgi:hypothetical protein